MSPEAPAQLEAGSPVGSGVALGAPAADPEVQLMLAFQRGDEEAFVKLYRAYRDRLVNFCRRMLGDQARGEEAAQDVFLKLYGARAAYTPRSRFSTYLYRVAINHCLNLKARKDAQPKDELDEQRRGSPQGGPDTDAERARLRAALAAALAALPENQRAALVLSQYEGLSYREAAEALEVTEPAIKSLVHRARATLSRALSAWMPEGATP